MIVVSPARPQQVSPSQPARQRTRDAEDQPAIANCAEQQDQTTAACFAYPRDIRFAASKNIIAPQRMSETAAG